jgi:hypothetical protein
MELRLESQAPADKGRGLNDGALSDVNAYGDDAAASLRGV